MDLIDKLVLQAEQEITELKRQRGVLEDSVRATNDKINNLKIKENEARKLYKQLRAKQPQRPRTEVPNHDPQETPPIVENPTTSTPRMDSAGASNGKPDYQGAIELLRDEGKEFVASEFAELSGATYDKAAGYLHTLVTRGLAVRTVSAKRGGRTRDQSKFKIA